MVSSKATTVKEYLASLPDDRRKEVEAVRKVILKHLPKGMKESMQYGMIGYVVPLSLYPAGYDVKRKEKEPLPYVALAAQKNYMALYMMNLYGNPKVDKWFRDAYKKSGKKLDMGKGCVRFKSVDDLPLDVIAKAVGITTVKEHIATYEKARGKR